MHSGQALYYPSLILYHLIKLSWPHRLTVRTLPSHGKNRGSIPLEAAIKSDGDMKKKLFLLPLIVLVTASCLFLHNRYAQLSRIERVIFEQEEIFQRTTPHQGINLLLICTELGFGGREVSTINLYKNLLKHEYKPIFLIAQDSGLEKELKQQKISHYSCHTKKILGKTLYFGFTKNIRKICKKHKINIIHCNHGRETPFAKKAASRLSSTAVILSQHDFKHIHPYLLKNLDGITAVNQKMLNLINKENQNKNLNIGKIEFLAPFFDPDPFLNFKALEDKRSFFQKTFNIKLKNIPIIACIANICRDKNQILLLEALHELVYKKNKPVQIIFAGNYSGRPWQDCQALIEKLNIGNYVHFIGFTTKVAEIIYSSDIKVLPSKKEAFGIACLETALMKKPIVGTAETGMMNIIQHEKSGLLFENENAQDLANQIERLLDNPDLAQQLGENAYEHVTKNFLPETTTIKLIEFYNETLKKKKSGT